MKNRLIYWIAFCLSALSIAVAVIVLIKVAAYVSAVVVAGVGLYFLIDIKIVSKRGLSNEDR